MENDTEIPYAQSEFKKRSMHRVLVLCNNNNSYVNSPIPLVDLAIRKLVRGRQKMDK